ncbi:MAG TPA: 2OG-Fe(II) oxygenase family protein [Xanthomonadales bacterium]|nr:2OG-Fe(II) oxygenase family protein [Xanthomonadales bacterium]
MSAIAHLRAAAAHLSARRLPEARAECAAALALSPASADALNLLGLVEHAAGDVAAARAALERAVAANPRYANAWMNLAAVLDADGTRAESAQALARGLALRRDAGASDWLDLGQRAAAARLDELAADAFERTLALAPGDLAALRAYAILRDRQHRPYEARALAARMLDAAPTVIGARYTFAAIWSKATEPADLARALDAGMAVLADDPRHAGAHDCVAIVLGKIGRRDDAVAHAREAVALAPAQAAFAATLVRLLEEDGRLDEAAAALADAARAGADNALLRRLRGTVALRSGDAESARAAFAAALALDPADQEAIAQQALALELAGDHAAASALRGEDAFVRAVALAAPPGFASLDAFNAQLADDIRRHSRLRFEPVGLAAKGGWLTEDLLADRTPAILGFEAALRAAIDAYIASLAGDPAHPFLRAIPQRWGINVWATRVAAQGTIDTHIHEQSWLSGAYYVALPPALGAGAGDHAGWIEFGRPYRSLPQPGARAVRTIQPREGTLLLFPSYLFHRTLPFAGVGERISISFDLAPAA